MILLYNLDLTWPAQEQFAAVEPAEALAKAIGEAGCDSALIPVTSNDIGPILKDYHPLDHIVLNWCEGLPGIPHSEWLVVEQLERSGFTFTGASAASLALAQDKRSIKRLLDENAVPTPIWQAYADVSTVRWQSFPAIVKPSAEHCSEGIDRNAVCLNEAELKARVAYIIERYRQPVLVEEFIDGREFHVSLWGNHKIDMLPPAEMEFSMFNDQHDRICSYEAKFVPESVSYQNIRTILPAVLSAAETNELDRVCRSAYAVTGCRDYARIDLRMKDGAFYVIDVNPNCDISPDTSTIMAAESIGCGYGEFGRRIIDLAAERRSQVGCAPQRGVL